ncbi:hypothetical protein D0863_11321 [Hortaea werneckii]|uniref:BTB domain-containing protein n=1 Tax=Hortaea werneckii TaxID=91943 RepID=A0A3M7DB69_HORWE|nr:hypothetical protein D0863_11321 [Hortaea werneckii]
MRPLLDTGEYSDLTIKCGDRTFQVHKNIVCEGATGTIELQSSTDPNAVEDDPSLDDPDAVKLMIDFLYLHDYERIATCFSDTLEVSAKRAFGAPDGDYGAIMDAKVYALGCKYQIPSLQSASLEKFETAADLVWDTEEFVHAVHLVYSTTPDSDKGLRDIATRVILEHDDELCDKPTMEVVIRRFDGLAYNLMKEQTKRRKEMKGPRCLTCGYMYIRNCSNTHTCMNQFICCDCYQGEENGGYYCEICCPRKPGRADRPAAIYHR